MTVREMIADDAPSVADLSAQLGYPTTAERIHERFLLIGINENNGFFVAEGDATDDVSLLGWVHIYGVHLLESESYAEIGGLVVDERARRQGTGRRLMAIAEAWAKERHYREVRLRSGMQRNDAHLFYEGIGYEKTRTSLCFRKTFERL